MSDVLVENFLPGKLGEYGLDYASLSLSFPGKIPYYRRLSRVLFYIFLQIQNKIINQNFAPLFFHFRISGCKRFLQKNCFAEQSYDKKQETLREKIISFLKENVFILIRKPNGKKWKCKDAAYKMEIILLSVDGKFNTMKKPLNFGGNFTLEKLAKLYHWIVSENPQYISRAYILLHLWFWTGRSVQQQVGQWLGGGAAHQVSS